ncbi:MAG: 50S ribosomal protein L10 [bacterium]|nr:50S ribosomal protein L10 [bacterium]
MARPEKVDEVTHLKARLDRSAAVILTDFRGLTVGEITVLRGRLRNVGAEYRVVKNRLFRIAADASGIEGLEQQLEGPTAAAFVSDDPVPVARVIQEFSRQSRKLTIKGSILAGAVIDDVRTRVLADLPDRAVLLARVVGGIAAPLSGLVGVLSGLPLKLVRALDQIREQRTAA